jgi:hypothetical protein
VAPRYSVEEIITALGATYRTIDIRSAAARHGDKWVNVYAVVRLSYEEPAVAEKRLRDLERDHGVLRTDMFQVFSASAHFPSGVSSVGS